MDVSELLETIKSMGNFFGHNSAVIKRNEILKLKFLCLIY